MQVNIWGLVNHPGRYEVSIATDLVQLVSYAGGPAADADLSAIRLTRFLKTEGGVTKSELLVDLDKLYRVNDASLILQPGDTIVFDRSSWANIRDLISVVTSAAIVTATVTTVIVTTRGH
jgi:protein involved in polysaccharide export with SLBB domain